MFFWNSCFFDDPADVGNLISDSSLCLFKHQFEHLEVHGSLIAELFIAKFRLKLRKVEKTMRPFRYDLNQIPYDYTLEVRNKFKK